MLECPKASKEARRLKTSRASLPQFPTARGMHVHPKSSHLASLEACFLSSAAWVAAPSVTAEKFSVAGVRGEVR